MQGRLEVFTGPMFSGKSAELLHHARQLEQENLRVGLFQSSENIRHDSIVSRNGDSLPARKIDSFEQIPFHKFDAVVIDEAQFFIDAFREAHVLDKARGIGRILLVGTLDRDFSGKTWPMYEALMRAKPDRLHELTALCGESSDNDVACNAPAEYSARLLNGQQLLEGPRQQIDGVEATYSPRCSEHYLPLQTVMQVTPLTI